MSDSKPRRSGKKGGGRERRLQSGSYSTRFEPTHQELVEQACRILKWTPAKFIRDAAVRRAAEIVNADGPARNRLAALAGRVLAHLTGKGGLRAERTVGPAQITEVNEHVADEWEVVAVPDIFEYSGDDDYATLTPRPIESQLSRELKLVLRDCPGEFGKLLLEQWELSEAGDGTFVPKVNVESLLSGCGNED